MKRMFLGVIKMIEKVLPIFILFVLISPVTAINVEKEVQQEAVIGQVITVKIKINNDLDRTLNTKIIEKTLPEFEYLDKEFIKRIELEGLEYLHLEWNLDIPPNSWKEVTYQIVPKRLGTYYLPKTEVITSDAIYYSEISRIHVECDNDGFCNTTIENSLNCPQDCPTGIKDGICDAVKDNRVDPDCKEGVDPDDPVIYEDKIAKAHSKGSMLVYGVLLASGVILLGIFGVVYKLLKKIKR